MWPGPGPDGYTAILARVGSGIRVEETEALRGCPPSRSTWNRIADPHRIRPAASAVFLALIRPDPQVPRTFASTANSHGLRRAWASARPVHNTILAVTDSRCPRLAGALAWRGATSRPVIRTAVLVSEWRETRRRTASRRTSSRPRTSLMKEAAVVARAAACVDDPRERLAGLLPPRFSRLGSCRPAAHRHAASAGCRTRRSDRRPFLLEGDRGRRANSSTRSAQAPPRADDVCRGPVSPSCWVARRGFTVASVGSGNA
jgi:hypothetical protein